ncbi:MAG: PRC-barrel domain-containing protein [Dehalococcoidia bacterium]|nr:PRC-barrel domain-containing protein [Dehalococcoidia bacterium]
MKLSELKGKSVITAQGENIGMVEDVLLHTNEQHVGALVVKAPRFAGPQILLDRDIGSFGGDAVLTKSVDNLQDQTRFGESAQMMSFGEASGRKVATTSGNYAGDLLDIHIDQATGQITGYEVTGGVFARMIGHTHTVEAGEYTRLGKDLLIVADKVIPVQLEEQAQPPTEAT